METVIVTTESQLAAIIEKVIGGFLKKEPPKPDEPDYISGNEEAVQFLCNNGFVMSRSMFDKLTMKGTIPCKRFQKRRLLFSKKELLRWAESMCQPVGKTDAALVLAKSANRKLKSKTVKV